MWRAARAATLRAPTRPGAWRGATETMIGKLLKSAFGKKPAEVVDRGAEIEALAARLASDVPPPERAQVIASLSEIDRAASANHGRVLDALVAFVRRERAKGETPRGEPGIDVRAALGAIARRPWVETETAPLALAGLDLGECVLAGADLRRADLAGSNVSHCNFLGSKLAGASLRGAILDESLMMALHLEKVDLAGASLRATNLTDAFLDDAVLANADLTFTVLVKASVKRADLSGATIHGTQLGGADLSGARGLTRAQLAGAETDNLTELPADLA